MLQSLKLVPVSLLFSSLTIGLPAAAQTTSPRNLQAPTTQELLEQCKRQGGDERAACEKRVREGGIPTTGSRNEPATQQPSPATQSRDATDPGKSAAPSQASAPNDPSARTRDSRTRMSQRSGDIQSKPQPTNESKNDPNISTDSAATRLKGPQDSTTDRTRNEDDAKTQGEDHRQSQSPSARPKPRAEAPKDRSPQ